MKKRVITELLLLTVTASLLGACGQKKDEKAGKEAEPAQTVSEAVSEEAAAETEAEPETEAETETETEAETPSDKDEKTNVPADTPKENDAVTTAYEEVLDEYRQVMEDQPDLEELASEGYSELLYYNYGMDNLGYSRLDLDGNGVDELLIGCMDEGENLVIAAYAYSGNRVIELFTSSERDCFFLRKNNKFLEEAAEEADITYYASYVMEEDFLSLEMMLAYDAALDPNAPWFDVDGENYEPMSEEAYNNRLERWTDEIVAPDYTALGK